MIKNVLSVIAGMAVAMATFMLFEQVSHSSNPLPANVNFNDREAAARYMQSLPSSSLLIVLAGYVIGSFLAGLVIKLVSRSNVKRPALITGLMLTITAIVNFYYVPHPMWFMAITIIVYVPATLAGFNMRSAKY